MTAKKQRIIQSALKLFAQNGIQATSAAMIAKDAEVSDALIFRHFKSMDGLLAEIIEDAEKKVGEMFIDVLMEEDPKLVIKKTLEIPFGDFSKEEIEYWRFQFKLKWELKTYDNSKMQPLQNKLAKAFKALKYKNPKLEAEYFIHFLDGLTSAVIRDVLPEQKKMKNFLLKKYNV